MTDIVKINEDNYKCETCDIYFDPDLQDYGTDIDNNNFCQKCCEDMPQFSGWGVFQDYPDEWHIRPLDEPDHMHDKMCHCNPRVIVENGIDIVNHSSFDGRECLEEALEILKKS